METMPLLEVRHLSKSYRTAHLLPSRQGQVVALRDVSFVIERGSTVALVGVSGAGKTTLARCLCFLERADSGEIRFEGLPFARFRKTATAVRPIQMIFQDPGASLNPRFTAFEVIEEPLRIVGRGNRENNQRIVHELMDVTGLAPDWSGRQSWQFSGGQRARLAIARALAADPSLLILDESLSGLDVSVRGHIANLLLDLQSTRGLSYLLVTHDRDLAAALADKVMSLRSGRLVGESIPGIEFRQEWACIG
jgi:ABC-type glutathione transport system ATPase component